MNYQSLLILSALIFSGIFTGLEIAFNTACLLKADYNKKRVRFVSELSNVFFNNRLQFLLTLRICKIISFVIFVAFFSSFFEKFLADYFQFQRHLFLIFSITVSFFPVYIGSIFIPVKIIRKNSIKILKFLSFPLFFVFLFFFPITKLSVWINNLIYGGKNKSFAFEKTADQIIFSRIHSEKELSNGENFAADQEQEKNEIKIFRNALDFSKIHLRECMIPRNEIEAVDKNVSVKELSKKFSETGFSKILIYDRSIDNILGYVHSRDLFKNPKDIQSVMIEVFIAPETMRANKLLKKLLEQRKNVALIVDEFGGTSGMVTIEDIIEEIFGEIDDEHDIKDYIEEQLSPSEYKFSGRLEIDYINDEYNLNLQKSKNYETLAGYIFTNHKKMPQVNEKIVHQGITFEILELNGPKIETVKLTTA